jgi:hypothetical protein
LEVVLPHRAFFTIDVEERAFSRPPAAGAAPTPAGRRESPDPVALLRTSYSANGTTNMGRVADGMLPFAR